MRAGISSLINILHWAKTEKIASFSFGIVLISHRGKNKTKTAWLSRLRNSRQNPIQNWSLSLARFLWHFFSRWSRQRPRGEIFMAQPGGGSSSSAQSHAAAATHFGMQHVDFSSISRCDAEFLRRLKKRANCATRTIERRGKLLCPEVSEVLCVCACTCD